MKKLLTLFSLVLFFSASVKAQIQHVIVEPYYVSDSLDATDTINGAARALPAGSKTYRIFVQLDHGYKIKKIYGTPSNPLKIMSTANFYNNIDRPTAYFGYKLVKSWFTGNPNLALDSWLTLGLCTTQYNAVLKADDTDGSLIGGTHNSGGTASVAGGITVNNDASAGIPVITADGMVPKTGTFTTWIDNGFRDIGASGQPDTTVFGTINTGSQFISSSAFLQQNSGVSGDSLTGNKVLIAQLTTTGDISFEINLELIDSTGSSIYLVPDNHGIVLTNDTAVSGMLKYPAVCGCQDPNFLEYNANFSCSNPAACHTRIVYGCTDTLACNYDPHANYNIEYLCCYPGRCNDRDISLVCPAISGEGSLQLYPNPAHDQITLQFSSGENNPTKYVIYNSFGTIVFQKDLGTRSGSITEEVEISDLQTGLYRVRIFTGTNTDSRTFMKD